MTTATHTIDAKGKRLGRVASQAAQILMGKDKVDYARNAAPKVKVAIVNASKVNMDEKKMEQKLYKAYSGYPGGLKIRTMRQVTEQKGKGFSELFRDAVHGMLPSNKLRPVMLKNLTISE